MSALTWKKMPFGYQAEDAGTSSLFEIVRQIRRGGRVTFELFVEGDKYGGEGTLADRKETAEFMFQTRQQRAAL